VLLASVGVHKSVSDAAAALGYSAEFSPPLLVVLLNRIMYRGGRPVKLQTYVNVSEHVGTKELYAVIVHVGTGQSGHYVALFKYPDAASNCRDTWWLYNDSTAGSRISRVGTLANVHQSINPATNGVLFWYWDVERYGPPMLAEFPLDT